MKKLIAVFGATVMLLTSAGVVLAAPWVPAGNQVTPNDKFVAFYQDGQHAIAGLGDQFFGRDLVMRRGNSGQFQQWFEGTDVNGNNVKIHSVWNLSHNGTCPANWVTVENAYPQWGSYLVPGATYCVHNNNY